MTYFGKLADFGDRLAAVDDAGRQITYTELAAAADRFATQIADHRCLAFLLCRNDVPTLVAYLAALRGGHVPLLLGADTPEAMLCEMKDLYRPEVLLYPNRDDSDKTGFAFTPYLEPTGYADEVALHPELGLLLTTSGSTGSPKLVRLSQQNPASNAQSIADYLELAADERPLTTLPFQYSYGLSVVNSHLAVGATLVLTEFSIVESPFWKVFKQREATSLAGVPFTYKTLDRLRFHTMKLPSLRYMTQAGGKLSADLVKRFAETCGEKGVRFYVMYGQTEATARIAYLDYHEAVRYPESIGRAIPGSSLELIHTSGDEAGSIIGASHIAGELVCRGPNVMLGYAESGKHLAAGDEFGGRLPTGDLGYRDAEGRYFITGRAKRFLKLHGNRINLDQLELQLARRKFECACAGNDDELLIATTNESTQDELGETVAALFGIHHSAFRIVLVPEIKRNAAGKVLYVETFEQCAECDD